VVYRIELRPVAVRQFSALPRAVQHRLRAKIDALANNPRPHGVKKLEGSPDLYRARAGDYRIIYQIQDAVLLITVVKVAHRKDVYRK
jgi:mRNA interferase RelE/StbE